MKKSQSTILKQIIAKLGSAVGTLHADYLTDDTELLSNGIHQDLKPSNILYDARFGLSIIDTEELGDSCMSGRPIAQDYPRLLFESLNLPLMYVLDDQDSDQLIGLYKIFVDNYVEKFDEHKHRVRAHIIGHLISAAADKEKLTQNMEALLVSKVNDSTIKKNVALLKQKFGVDDKSLLEIKPLIPLITFGEKLCEAKFKKTLGNITREATKTKFWQFYNQQNLGDFQKRLSNTGLTAEALEYWLFFEGKIVPRDKFNSEGSLQLAEVVKQKSLIENDSNFIITIDEKPAYFVIELDSLPKLMDIYSGCFETKDAKRRCFLVNDADINKY